MTVTPQRAVVYGSKFYAGTLYGAAEMVVNRALSGAGGYGTLTGAHGLTAAQTNEDWKRALDGSWCNFPDGAPVSWRIRRAGWSRAQRIPGPDLMPHVIRLGRPYGLRHFLFGSSPDVLSGLRHQLGVQCRGAEICGSLSPPFAAFTAQDDADLTAAVEAAQPHIIWVGLGAPKQDIWMHRRAYDFPSVLCMGVGAAFDFVSGNKPRAPEWMQRSGLEWFHRMAREPRNLGPRYTVATSKFAALVAADVARRAAQPGAEAAVRVLVVHNRYRSVQPSGENQAAIEEADALREYGVDVRTLTFDSDEIETWPIHRRAMVPAGVIWSFSGAGRVRDAVRSARPDVVHFHNTFPLISPAGPRRAHGDGVSVVQTLHNYRPICPAATLFRDGHVCEECVGRPPLPAIRHGCYRNSHAATVPLAISDAVHSRIGTWRSAVDLYLTPSAFTRAQYVAAGWPADRIAVKHNVVTEPSVSRAAPGRGFLCLARLSPEKGVSRMLEAWQRAFPDGGEGLSVVGSGELESQLRSTFDSSHGIEFLGQRSREEVWTMIARARAVIVPSVWYEVFGRTAAEASAAGVPVLAARIGGLPEVVEDGVSGLLFEPDEQQSMAAGLLRLAGDDELCRRLGAAGRKRYEERFSPQATTEGLVAQYRRAAGRSVEARTVAKVASA